MNKVLKKLTQYFSLLKNFGLLWILRRTIYAVTQKAGLSTLRSPQGRWSADPARSFYQIFDNSKSPLSTAIKLNPWFHTRIQYPKELLSLATRKHGQPSAKSDEQSTFDLMKNGKLRYFNKHLVDTEFPILWHLHPITKTTINNELHWSSINDFGHGDIKWVWEPSRFTFAFDLAREYLRTGNEEIPSFFWLVFEDWMEQNQPNCGVNWKCGQEVALRLIAICFALRVFISAPSTQQKQIAMVAKLASVSGQRIASNINYALQQKNNHGISEAAGLWTVGLLFPTMKHGNAWTQKAQRLLINQAVELIYPSGNCSQHSVNYLRLMLQTYSWCICLGKSADQPLFENDQRSNKAIAHLQAAIEFLHSIMDMKTGKVPRFGANDSALLFNISECDASDFRPALQSLSLILDNKRLFSTGPWDEEAFLLTGKDSQNVPEVSRRNNDSAAPRDDGIAVLRDNDSFASLRIQKSFIHRPSHADLLHVDIFWKGINIAIDPGTYSYNAPEPWQMPFAQTEFHNTVTVNDSDQMNRFSRFIWTDWAETFQSPAMEDETPKKNRLAYTHTGYKKYHSGCLHTRGVFSLGENAWLIHDTITANSNNKYRLHWLLGDFTYKSIEPLCGLDLETLSGVYQVRLLCNCPSFRSTVVRATEASPRGWFAPHYSHLEPAISLDLTVEASSAEFWTLFGPPPYDLKRIDQNIVVSQGTAKKTIWESTVKN